MTVINDDRLLSNNYILIALILWSKDAAWIKVKTLFVMYLKHKPLAKTNTAFRMEGWERKSKQMELQSKQE